MRPSLPHNLTWRSAMLTDLTEVVGFVGRFTALPQRPDNVQPAIGQAAIGVAFGLALVTCLVEVCSSPSRFANGAIGKLLGGIAVIVVTSSAEFDVATLAAGDGNRRGAGDGGQPSARGITLPMVAKHNQQLGSQQSTGARQRMEDKGIRVLLEKRLDLEKRSRNARRTVFSDSRKHPRLADRSATKGHASDYAAGRCSWSTGRPR